MFELGVGDWGVLAGILTAIAIGARWEWSTKLKRAIEEKNELKSQLQDAKSELGEIKGQIAVRDSSSVKRPLIRERAADVELDDDELVYLSGAIKDKWRVHQWDEHKNRLIQNRVMEKHLVSFGSMSIFVTELGREVYELNKSRLGN